MPGSAQSFTQMASVALACNVGALDPVARAEHFKWIREDLPRLLTGVKEAPDGIVLEFRAEDLLSVARFVDRERRCCPFLRFDLALPPGEGVLRLQLTGPAGVKHLLNAELQLGGNGYWRGVLKSMIAAAIVVSKSCRAESPSSRRAAP